MIYKKKFQNSGNGIDVSEYAISNAMESVKNNVQVANAKTYHSAIAF